MDARPHTQAAFRQHVARCLEHAQAVYGIDFGRVTVTFDLRGTKAGQAIQRPHDELGFTYRLDFNKEAIKLDWDNMVSSVIPHEVAHLVAFAAPALNANYHNYQWMKIAQALGDTRKGATCHTMKLRGTRRGPRFLYRNDTGTEVEVTRNMHRSVQTGECVIRYERQIFTPQHYQGMA